MIIIDNRNGSAGDSGDSAGNEAADINHGGYDGHSQGKTIILGCSLLM